MSPWKTLYLFVAKYLQSVTIKKKKDRRISLNYLAIFWFKSQFLRMNQTFYKLAKTSHY